MLILSHLRQLFDVQTCKRTFNDFTSTLLDGSRRSVMH